MIDHEKKNISSTRFRPYIPEGLTRRLAVVNQICAKYLF